MQILNFKALEIFSAALKLPTCVHSLLTQLKASKPSIVDQKLDVICLAQYLNLCKKMAKQKSLTHGLD